MKKLWWLLVGIIFLIITDQVTKGIVDSSFNLYESIPVIDGFFNLTYVRNKGAAWGMGAEFGDGFRMILFKILPVLVVFGLFYALYKSLKDALHISIAYALIIAGAIGNLIDRIFLDFVVDFFDVYIGNHHWPAFNVADACISIAAGIIIYDSLFLQKKSKKA